MSEVFVPRRRSPQRERGLKCGDMAHWEIGGASLPSEGAWIEICGCLFEAEKDESLPSEGAWIEIFLISYNLDLHKASLPSEGAWIEIEYDTFDLVNLECRSPQRERGLKCLYSA